MKKLIEINYFTYIIVLSFLLCGYFKYLLIIFVIFFIHELGHIICLIIFKRKIQQIVIMPFGGLIKLDGYISNPIFEDLIISMGGIIIQIVFGLIINICFNDVDDFNYYNNLIMIFNLLPIHPLDGFKVFRLLLEYILPYKWVLTISIWFSSVFMGILVIFFKEFLFNNLLVLFFMVYMNYKEYLLIGYIMNRFYLERMHNKFCFRRVKIINKISHMYKNRRNFLNGFDEHTFLTNYFYNR